MHEPGVCTVMFNFFVVLRAMYAVPQSKVGCYIHV